MCILKASCEVSPGKIRIPLLFGIGATLTVTFPSGFHPRTTIPHIMEGSAPASISIALPQFSSALN
ncbi:MAG: hypothetical protein OEW33_16500, partial [Nitrospirota bacterium]|nr:hypothetical protein [Nitrospirota bacterium]